MSETKVQYKAEEQDMQIVDEAPHNHFTTIPNMVDDMDLSPFAFRLYAHIRRVAGENGRCWQSTATMAKACRMSAGKVSECKQELAGTTPPLIRIHEVTVNNSTYHQITITDIWKQNSAKFSSLTKDTPSLSEGGASCGEGGPSHSETKKNPIKNTPVVNINSDIDQIFLDHFGFFLAPKEKGRWRALVDAVGVEQAAQIADWAVRKEIHMNNRGGLMDSLETSAKNWITKPAGVGTGRKDTAEERQSKTMANIAAGIRLAADREAANG